MHMKTNFAMLALLLGMASCGGSKTESLGGTSWKLAATENIPDEAIAAEPDAFTIEFDAADTMAYGRTNCNRFFGKYEETADGGLRFGNIGATRMACPHMEYELDFLQMLNSVDRYTVRDGELTFYGNSVPLATFHPIEPASEAD